MSDLFELPNNAESFYRKAQNHLKQNDFSKAENFLLKSYQLEANLQVFEELVSLYIQLGKSQALKDLWQKAYPEPQVIYDSPEVSHLYALSIPDIYNIQDALLELYQLRDQAVNDDTLLYEINDRIQHLQGNKALIDAITQSQSEADYEAILSDSANKGALFLLQQLKFLYTEPLAVIEPFYLTILHSKQILNYIKSDILHYLLTVNYQESITLAWFNDLVTIDVSTLVPYKECPIYQQTIDLIDDYCQDNNPHLFEGIIHQFTLNILCFYPYIETTVKDGQNWLDIFLYTNGLEDINPEDFDNDLLHYVQRANSEMSQILG